MHGGVLLASVDPERLIADLAFRYTTVDEHVATKPKQEQAAHGAELLALAPRVRAQLQASLNRTLRYVGPAGATRCWPSRVPAATAPTANGTAAAPLSPVYRVSSRLLKTNSIEIVWK